MNGNPITLTKTALDVVTIYATVYITFSVVSSAGVKMCGLTHGNPLLDYLTGSSIGTHYFFTAQSPESNLIGKNSRGLIGTPNFKSAAVTWTADVPNKKMYTNTLRLGVSDANDGSLVMTEVCLGAPDSDNSAYPRGIISGDLTNTGFYAGLNLTGVPVGTGDGITTKFNLPSNSIKGIGLTAYVDGTPTSVTMVGIQSFYVAINQDGSKFVSIDDGAGEPVYLGTYIDSTWTIYNTGVADGVPAGNGHFLYSTANLDWIAFYYMTTLYVNKTVPQITFSTAPANGAVITADYTADGIHKTLQRVIDLYVEITFGEVT